ncbi:MAG: flavodoxin [Pseudomonadota bacterium]
MKSLLIVYHSQSGACARLAQAASDGASEESEVRVITLRAWDAGTTDLVKADALLFIAAENSGRLAGGAKDFLDRTFYPCTDRGLVLPYALAISAGNDGSGAQRDAERIFRGYPFKPVAQALICRGEPGDGALRDCRELGQALAAGLTMGIY